MFYYDVASFNVAEVPEPFNQGFEIGPLFLGAASVPKHPDYRNSSRLLRARRERPRGRRAAEQRDERAAPHGAPLLRPRAAHYHAVDAPVRHGKNCALMSQMGHIDSAMSATCPLYPQSLQRRTVSKGVRS